MVLKGTANISLSGVFIYRKKYLNSENITLTVVKLVVSVSLAS